jgi:hypothetical protein
VALFSTAAVALSGIFGHYVYTRVSAGFHGERSLGQSFLADVTRSIELMEPGRGRDRLVAEVESFGQGEFLRSGKKRRRARVRQLVIDVDAALGQHAGRPGWGEERVRQVASGVRGNLEGYLARIDRRLGRSKWERIAGLWRYLHLPLFCVTLFAAAIHVTKVWSLIEAEPSTEERVLEAGARTPGGPAAGGSPDGEPPRIDGRFAAGAGGVETDTTRTSADEPRAPAGPATSVAPAAGPVTTQSEIARRVKVEAIRIAPAVPSAPTGPANVGELQKALPPVLLQEPRMAQRADAADEARRAITTPAEPPARIRPAPVQARPPRAVAAAPTAPELIAPRDEPPAARAAAASEAPTRHSAPSPKLAVAADQPRAALGGPKGDSAPPRAAPDPVAELGRKVAQWDNSGRLDPRTVRERLDILKKDRTFDHGKTRFPLTGKHKTVACESCHKTTLKDTPRRCIDCHRKDDVHRGRRPNCEKCHVTTDWGTLKR